MTEKEEASTVLIGGDHDGQPFPCTTPPLPNLVMLASDSDKSEGYALRAYSNASEHRLFYVLDGFPKDQASELMRQRWDQGLRTES
jgi:hypothetical protein